MILSVCPYCNGKLEIKECFCPECNLILRGSFEASCFANLKAEQLEFIKLFILVQGNIKEMEKQLNISYPTVKNRLAEITKVLGYQERKNNDFTDIIEDLENGFITVNEAINMIEERRKNQ